MNRGRYDQLAQADGELWRRMGQGEHSAAHCGDAFQRQLPASADVTACGAHALRRDER